MIRPQVIQQFLDRNLDNFDWVKSLVPSQIEGVLSRAVPPHLYADLWDHQKAALAIILHQPRFIFHVGMGGGKTRLMLTHMQLRKLRGEQVRAIVFVPYVSAVQTWVDEVAKFAPELTCVPLTGSSKENACRIQTSPTAEIVCCCYASAIHIGAGVYSDFNTLIMDEVHKVKNHTTKTFKLCKAISEKADYVYGLTGTPFGRDLQDLWAEFYCIDFGETLGPNISFFREVFFKKKYRFYGGVEYTPIKKRVPALQRSIKNRSLHYSVKEFGGNMPSKQYIQIGIPKPSGIEAYVSRELLNLREAVQAQDTKLAGNAFMQLRQLASGFVTFKDDEERIKVRFDENPKVDKLVELIEAMPTECKMVVFHDYIYTGDLISERLQKLSIRHSRIYGGTKDKPAQLRNFANLPECRVLVLNSQSGSSALNLQFANYCVFVESPSVIDREQAEARVYRPGQVNKVFIYDLFMDGTIDLEYYIAVRAGGDLLKDFLSGKKEVHHAALESNQVRSHR